VNQETRGSHACFVCGEHVNWATSVADGILMLHGNEVKAVATVTGKNSQTEDLLCEVQVKCPKCGNINQFIHKAAFLT
jgi:hypothetical protein